MNKRVTTLISIVGNKLFATIFTLILVLFVGDDGEQFAGKDRTSKRWMSRLNKLRSQDGYVNTSERKAGRVSGWTAGMEIFHFSHRCVANQGLRWRGREMSGRFIGDRKSQTGSVDGIRNMARSLSLTSLKRFGEAEEGWEFADEKHGQLRLEKWSRLRCAECGRSGRA